MKLVFDWSDSMTAVPTSYQAQTGTVSWSVGQYLQDRPLDHRHIQLPAGPQLGRASASSGTPWSRTGRWSTGRSTSTGRDIEKAYSLNGVTWHSSYLTSIRPDSIESGSEFSSWVNIADGVYTLYYMLADPYDERILPRHGAARQQRGRERTSSRRSTTPSGPRETSTPASTARRRTSLRG